MYLGMEVGGNPRKKQLWEPVMNKISNRLSSWKGRFLSLAGRICLLKLVFTPVPLFYLSFSKAPESVCKNIISMQRKFLWGWGKDTKPISWVSWEKACQPKEEGGLRIKDIRILNVALLAKWKWRFLIEDRGRWREILVSKYGKESRSNQIPLKHQS